MNKITAYFDPCRGKNITEQMLDEILHKHLKSSSNTEKPEKEVVKNMVADICSGTSCCSTEEQIEHIIRSLSCNCLHGNVDLNIWKKCFRYWTRKDTKEKSALLVIDVQNDFISGSLALRNCPAKQEGEDVVEVINKLKKDNKFDLVVFSLDWHPENHCSFITNVDKYPIHPTSKVKAENAKLMDCVVYDGDPPQQQTMWPVHCVQGSVGAKLHSDLKVDAKDTLVYKGTVLAIDSYSAFWDNGKLSQTDLFSILLDNNITQAFVCGLATDFCVSFTAVDCAEHGLKTYMIDDASRGVTDETIQSAKKKMVETGVKIIQSSQVAALLKGD